MRRIILPLLIIFTCSIPSKKNFAQSINESIEKTRKAAEKSIDSMNVLLSQTGEDTIRVNLYHLIALEKQKLLNGFAKMKVYADSALQLAEKINYTKGIAQAHKLLAMVESSAGGNKLYAINHARFALKKMEEINDKKEIAELCSMLGSYYSSTNNFQEGMTYRMRALKIREELGDQQAVTNSLEGIASAYRHNGDYSEAVKYYKAVLKYNLENKKYSGAVYIYHQLSCVYPAMGNYQEELNCNLAAIKIMDETGVSVLPTFIFNNTAACYSRLKNYPEAIKYRQRLIKYYEKQNDTSSQSKEYCYIGLYYKRMNQHKDADEYINRAIQLGEKAQNKTGLAETYASLASYSHEKFDYTAAINYYQKSIDSRKQTIDTLYVALTYQLLGDVYLEQGNFSTALNAFMEAVIISRTKKNTDLLNALFLRLTATYLAMQNFNEAQKNAVIALQMAKENNDECRMSIAYYHLGDIYTQKATRLIKQNGNRDSIISLLAEAYKNHISCLQYNDKMCDENSIASSHLGIGKTYEAEADFIRLQRGNPDTIEAKQKKALSYYMLALKKFETNGKKKETIDCEFTIAGLLIKEGKNKEAQVWLDKGLLLAKEIGLREYIQLLYAALSETNRKLGNYKSAYEYANKSALLKDSLFNNESVKKIEELKTRLEVEKAIADEKALQQRALAQMQFDHLRKEDSIKYQKRLTEEELIQQQLLAKQQEQELLLKQTSLDLISKQNELNRLGFLNTQVALEAEQLRRQENEQQLTIVEKEKELQEKNAAEAKALSEKEKIEAKRKTELLMLGFGMLVLVLTFAFLYLRQRTLKQRAVERADAVHKMAELELQSLRAQLNPHFMFNSLNAIQDLILKQDNRNSHRYLSQFSKLLRMMLDNASQPFIPLRKELDFLELYLSLEKLRVPDLQYSIEKDPQINADERRIPNMMLQPYIENAIWHGLSHKEKDRKLEVRIHQIDHSLKFEVEDNGVGRNKADELKSLYRKEHHSKGMELLSKRFQLLTKEFGSAVEAKITDLANNGEAAGTLVEINVPFELADQLKYHSTVTKL